MLASILAVAAVLISALALVSSWFFSRQAAVVKLRADVLQAIADHGRRMDHLEEDWTRARGGLQALVARIQKKIGPKVDLANPSDGAPPEGPDPNDPEAVRAALNRRFL